jgi:hypothetical protein
LHLRGIANFKKIDGPASKFNPAEISAYSFVILASSTNTGKL